VKWCLTKEFHHEEEEDRHGKGEQDLDRHAGNEFFQLQEMGMRDDHVDVIDEDGEEDVGKGRKIVGPQIANEIEKAEESRDGRGDGQIQEPRPLRTCFEG